MAADLSQPPASDANTLVQRGQQLYQAGDLRGAMSLFQQALELEPEHIVANFQIALVARHSGSDALSCQFFAKAADGLRQIAAVSEGNRDLWLMLVSALAGAGDEAALPEAISDARIALGDTAAAVHALGVNLANFGAVGPALALFEEAAAAEPDNPAFLKALGRTLSDHGRNTEAIGHLERAMSLLPEDAELADSLAAIYGHSNLTADRAADYCRRAADLDPTPQRFLTLADRLRLHARFDEAIAALEEGLARCAPADPRQQGALLQALGVNLELAARADEAAAAWRRALEACRRVPPQSGGGRSVGDACQELRLLWRLGRRDEARGLMRAIKGDTDPAQYAYPQHSYSADMAAALARLRAVVGGRDVFVLQHGPSIAALDARIGDFAGHDICFATAHSFAFFEQGMLARLQAKVELAMVSNPMVLREHADQVVEYLGRDGRELLLSSRYCFDTIGAGLPDAAAVEAAHADKLLFFPPPDTVLLPLPPTPLQFPLCNTLSCTLPFLVLGGARQVFLFGVDGVGRDAAGGHERFGSGDPHYRYEASDEAEKRALALNLLVDTLTFDFAAELGLEAIAVLYDLPVPPIYTVSPDSHIALFPRIGLDGCLDLVRRPSS